MRITARAQLSRKSAEREGKGRDGTGERAEAFGLRQIMMQAMRLTNDEHRQEAEARVEHVRAEPVAKDADAGQHQFRAFHHGDRALVCGGANEIAERHLQRGPSDQQPGDAEYDRVTECQDGNAGRCRQCQAAARTSAAPTGHRRTR